MNREAAAADLYQGVVEAGPDEVEAFAEAMAAYKRQSGRLFPTWSEVLEVLVALGYAKAPGVATAA